jgi:hypothetical protein
MLVISNKKNPLNFIKMEKWDAINNTFKGYVGYCENGDKYLSWDQRDDIPVFSGTDKVGINIREQHFQVFREIYMTDEGKIIQPIISTKYYILNMKGFFIYNYKSQPPDSRPNLRRIIASLLTF